jgi:hypothetical protein
MTWRGVVFALGVVAVAIGLASGRVLEVRWTESHGCAQDWLVGDVCAPEVRLAVGEQGVFRVGVPQATANVTPPSFWLYRLENYSASTGKGDAVALDTDDGLLDGTNPCTAPPCELVFAPRTATVSPPDLLRYMYGSHVVDQPRGNSLSVVGSRIFEKIGIFREKDLSHTHTRPHSFRLQQDRQ